MCQDPRGKIFGLLGMVEDRTPVQNLIDYSSSVESVYEAVARSFFQDGIIDALLFCKPSPGLPSWVPDWDRDERKDKPEKLPFRILGEVMPYTEPRARNCKCLVSITKPVQPEILVLDGTLVGDVEAVGAVWNETTLDSLPRVWLDVPGAQRMFAEVKSLLEDSTYSAEDNRWKRPGASPLATEN